VGEGGDGVRWDEEGNVIMCYHKILPHFSPLSNMQSNFMQCSTI
jgi:hypothetical protein